MTFRTSRASRIMIIRPALPKTRSTEDVYPPQLWIDAAVYFASLQGEEALLPGGRYMCARVLADRKLCFLEGYSLGEVAG